MARMRTIKPSAFRSLSLAEVERGLRWTFAGLWTECDDDGRMVWDARLVKSAIYPLDDAITTDVVIADVRELERVGSVCEYEIEGRKYLHVPHWDLHAHPNRKVKSTLPECPRTTHGLPDECMLTDDAVSTHGGLTPVVVVVEEGSSRGEEGVTFSEPALNGHSPPTTPKRTPAPLSGTRIIVETWLTALRKPPPEAIIGQVSTQVARMLGDGITPTDVTAGLSAWQKKGNLAPSVLPSVVHEVMNGPPPGRSRPQQETDDAFARAAERMGVKK